MSGTNDHAGALLAIQKLKLYADDKDNHLVPEQVTQIYVLCRLLDSKGIRNTLNLARTVIRPPTPPQSDCYEAVANMIQVALAVFCLRKLAKEMAPVALIPQTHYDYFISHINIFGLKAGVAFAQLNTEIARTKAVRTRWQFFDRYVREVQAMHPEQVGVAQAAVAIHTTDLTHVLATSSDPGPKPSVANLAERLSARRAERAKRRSTG